MYHHSVPLHTPWAHPSVTEAGQNLFTLVQVAGTDSRMWVSFLGRSCYKNSCTTGAIWPVLLSMSAARITCSSPLNFLSIKEWVVPLFRAAVVWSKLRSSWIIATAVLRPLSGYSSSQQICATERNTHSFTHKPQWPWLGVQGCSG